MNHRWKARKNLGPYLFCSICGADQLVVGETSECLIARHADPEINALYVARREAASRSNESGYKGIKGWADLEAIQAKLSTLDPEGDWYFEGDRWDGRGWRVSRPQVAS